MFFEILLGLFATSIVLAIAAFLFFVFDAEVLHGHFAKKLRAFFGVVEK
jgi:hypothetical protein